MDAWDGWETGRVVVFFAAVMWMGMWVQLGLLHWGAAFRRWEMWAPVLLTPVFIAGGIVAGIDREGILGWIGVAAFTVGALEGMAGLFFHLQGVSAQIGGFSVRNAIAGPPPVLPMAYSLVGVLGLIGLFWNA